MPGGKDGLPEVRFKRSGAAVAGTAALDAAGDEKPAGAMLGTARSQPIPGTQLSRILVNTFFELKLLANDLERLFEALAGILIRA